MIINIDLSTKSLNKAIKQLKKAQTDLKGIITQEYLLECSRAIIELANIELDNVDIGENVKSEIKESWQEPDYDKTLKTVTITNTCDKSVYVEFGTGIVGQANSHPNADNTNYEYNVDSKYKDANGMWIFKPETDADIDIIKPYIITRTTHTVSTRGMRASLYVYRAIQIFIDTKMYQKIWENVKRKYFK